MTKPFIVIGDKTSHGGTVVGGSSTATTHGTQIARLGDKVTCPKCGPNTIASGDSTMMVMGQPVARHGDKTACGATLIAGQNVTTTEG
ncbi:MAG: PAAR domain-containing protein [Rhodanobacter sp.]